MVVDDLDLVRVAIAPGEADPELVVDPNAVLPGAVTLKSFQLVAGQRQIPQSPGLVDLVQLAPGGPLNTLEPFRKPVVENRPGFGVAKRPDHRL
jgi:hypothetical protein